MGRVGDVFVCKTFKRAMQTSMPCALAARGGGVHLDTQAEGALFVRPHRTDTNQLARDFFAAFVADGQHHRVFPCTAVGGIAKAAFHAQWRGRGRRSRAVSWFAEAQFVTAGRTHASTFQDGLAAVRTRACRPGRARWCIAHEVAPSCPRFLCALLPSAASSQPNSA